MPGAVKNNIFRWVIGTLMLSFFLSIDLRAQNISGVINIYAQVLDVDTCQNQVLVSDAAGFSVGDRVLLIQMKGATIDESNTASFGTISDYGNSGNYEFGNIAEIDGLFITLKNKIVRLYNAPEGFVQLVRVPQYSDPTVSGTVNALPWDGRIGGIVVFEASGNVALNADIDVSRMGFQGGKILTNQSHTPDQIDYFVPLVAELDAAKGEGIAQTIVGMEAGRGPQANGGGGGDGINAGGGGGSNAGTGGLGGDQGDNVTFSRMANGGLGGRAIDYTSLKNRIFLGGGGGAGQSNDTSGTPGGNGGGIVIIRANTINGGGGKIIADGDSARVAGSDGAGGGGAGGTIVLDVNQINNNPQLIAQGGKGGDNNADYVNVKQSAFCFAPGGGGGGGCVVVKGPSVPPSNLNGGNPGIVVLSKLPCSGTSYGAVAGNKGGGIWNNVIIDENNSFTYPRIAKSRDTICEGDIAQLDLPGAHGYRWTPNIGLDNNLISNPKASPPSTTRYTVSYLDDRNCAFLDTVLVIVNPRPQPKIAGSSDVCQNQTFSYSITPFPGASYQWVVAGGNIISGQGTEMLAVQWTNVSGGAINVGVTAAGTGCFGEDSLAINIHPAITPTIMGGGTICNGDSVQLSAMPTNLSHYLWSTGDTVPNIMVTKAGKYFLQTVSLGGCTTYSDTLTVIVNPIPTVTIQATTTIMPDTGGVDTLYLSSKFTSQLWGNKATTDSIFITDSGTYTVDVTDSNGCKATAQIYVPRDIKPPEITLSIDSTLQGSPCDVIVVPINIDTSYEMPPSGATNYITEITFDESILSPLDKTNYTIKGRWGTITLYGTRPDAQTLGVLNSLKFGVALGDTTATVISIKTFQFTNGKKVLIKTYNGLFKLTNLCQQGGTRLFAESDSLLLKQNIPNPAGGATSITYSLLEEGSTKLWISDMLGRNISTVFDSWMKPGEYSVSINTSSLSNGNYFYILETPTAVRRRMMRIEK